MNLFILFFDSWENFIHKIVIPL